MNLKEYIKEKRPTLSDSSITTYNSILTNLYKKVFGSTDIDMANFEDTDKILKFLNDLPPNKSKTVLSALVVITNNDKYRKAMLADIAEYNAKMAEQIKSPTQQENWVSTAEIQSKFDELKHIADLLYKKKALTLVDLQQIQNYIILCLLSGIYIPPRRSKDYCDFKIKDINEATDNYMKKNEMIFNSYKTAKFYGEQKVAVPPTLKKILTKWISINPTDWLLFDSNMNKLSNVKLNQRFAKIFGGHIGTNSMRHTYLTDKFGDTINSKKSLQKDMTEMGSSINMAPIYIKQ